MEYLTVLIIFVMFSSYFAYKLLEQKPVYLEEVKSEIYRSESYRLSEILTNDPGEPLEWYDFLTVEQVIEETSRLGLSNHTENKTNHVIEEKIVMLGDLCDYEDGYNIVKERLGASYDFSIIVTDLSREAPEETFGSVQCEPSSIGEVKSSIKRFISFGSGYYGEVAVSVW